MALKSLKVLPIISIGFDSRSSTYICIVKYKKATKSFYLGNESKLKSRLQQFYLDDLNIKKMDFIKEEVKMIVSNVISDFINNFSLSQTCIADINDLAPLGATPMYVSNKRSKVKSGFS